MRLYVFMLDGNVDGPIARHVQPNKPRVCAKAVLHKLSDAN